MEECGDATHLKPLYTPSVSKAASIDEALPVTAAVAVLQDPLQLGGGQELTGSSASCESARGPRCSSNKKQWSATI